MHHRISAIQAINRVVERHDEYPSITSISSVVQEGSKDELSTRLWCFDQDSDGPTEESTDGQEGTERAVEWQ